MEKYGGKRYYRIRVPVFWLLVICVVLLFFGIYFKDELHKKWLHSGGMEDVTFQGLTSKLEDQGNCYFCGSSDYSLVDVFRKSGRIGVILLNDWYVLEFHIKSRDESVPSAEEASTQVETVVLLYRKKPDSTISVKVEFGEDDVC